MKIVFEGLREDVTWNNGEIVTSPELLNYIETIIKNNVCIVDESLECDLMHYLPSLDNIVGFTAAIYRASNGTCRLKAAPEAFKDWYSPLRKPWNMTLPGYPVVD